MQFPIVARTPAKLNLGLEVLGRRPDGYHDILTVMQTVDIFDEMHFTPGDEHFEYVSDPAVAPDEDIARPVLESRATELGWAGRLELRKLIPMAAGLGGGSSDAALALRLAYAGERASDLEKRAAAIGADVPFFIRGGVALASGIGTDLHRLPDQSIWYVIVVPAIALGNKTGSMYSSLTADDFSSGEAVSEIARAIQNREPLPDRLPNAFERAMHEHDTVQNAWNLVRSVAGRVALSGAGPAVYAWFADQEEADAVAAEVRNRTDMPVLLAGCVNRYRESDQIEQLARALRARDAPLSERSG